MNRIRQMLAACLMLAAVTASAAVTEGDAVLNKFFSESARRSGTTPAPVAAPRKPKPQPAPAPSPAPSQPASGSNGRAQPDWAFTPGKLCTTSDPGFKEYRYAEHIPYCQRNVTQQMKQEVAAHYGVPQSAWGNYEFDHLIPLAIGGNSHVENVWPQPRGANGSDDKDKLENELFLKMQAGTMSQAEAVREIYAWFGRNYPAQAAAMGIASN